MNDTLQIGTLRAPASAGHNATRMPLERALAAADLRPSGLPAGAVLIVQRLATTLPTAGRAWEQRARAQVEELYRHAARPAHGHDARNAQAVLFTDRAELLACLLDDLLAHRATAQWWWRCYLRGRPVQLGHVPSLLAEELTALPATFAHLAARGRAVAVAHALPPPAARALAERLAIAYDAGTLPLQSQQTHQPASRPAAPNATASPPWTPQPPSLAREQHLLLGLALTISERPTAPRTPHFRRALAAWWQAAESSPPLSIPSREATHTPTPDAEAPTIQQSPHTAPDSRLFPPQTSATTPTRSKPTAPKPEQNAAHNSVPPAVTPVEHAPAETAQQPTSAVMQTPQTSIPREPHTAPPITSGSASTAPQSAPQHIAAASTTQPITANQATPTPHITSADHTPQTDAPEAPEAPWLNALGAHPTELGGVLFLINLLIYLKLPELFAPTWPLERTISAWRLLELVARGLLTDAAQHSNDPLWHALAALDGRAADTPFAQLHKSRLRRARPAQRHVQPVRPSRAYRIPSVWLHALPADPDERLYWTTSRRHLRIWSSRGFVLFDGAVPRLNSKSVQTILAQLGVAVHQLEKTSAHPPSPRSPMPAETPAWVQRWLSLSLPYIRLRLVLALGLHPHDDLDAPLLARRGTLVVSGTHVDLMLSLVSTSIDVRLAGLDRNPGWLAEYGRVILFHFVTPEQEAQQ